MVQIKYNHRKTESSRAASFSKLGNNNLIFKTELIFIFHHPLSLQPPSQYQHESLSLLWSRFTYTIPTIPTNTHSSIPQLFFNSLLVNTATPTVPTKNPFPNRSPSANSSCDTGPMSGRALW